LNKHWQLAHAFSTSNSKTHGIDDGPIYSNIGVTSSALAVQMFGNAQDLQQQNVWYDDGPIHCNIPLTSSALVVHVLQITIAWTLRCYTMLLTLVPCQV
jgi:hypothetical protein